MSGVFSTHKTCEGARRVAVPGLAAAGDAAVPALLALLQRTRAGGGEAEQRAVAYTADALGEAAASGQHWVSALRALGETQCALEAAVVAGHPLSANPAGSVLAAVEHIAQRAVAAGDAAACRLAGDILLRALDGPAASAAAAAVASLAVADSRLLGAGASAALVRRLSEIEERAKTHRERAVAAEALRRLVVPRAGTALASAQRRVIQSLLEAAWSPPEEDPRQNGQIAGAQNFGVAAAAAK